MTDRTANYVTAPVSIGEVLDKLSILEIKEEKITDPDKLIDIRYETHQLEMSIAHLNLFEEYVGVNDLYLGLDAVNRRLWDVEDRLRELEQEQNFGKEFIDLARNVYQLNDNRAGFKRELNIITGSQVREVKSYAGM